MFYTKTIGNQAINVKEKKKTQYEGERGKKRKLVRVKIGCCTVRTFPKTSSNQRSFIVFKIINIHNGSFSVRKGIAKVTASSHTKKLKEEKPTVSWLC